MMASGEMSHGDEDIVCEKHTVPGLTCDYARLLERLLVLSPNFSHRMAKLEMAGEEKNDAGRYFTLTSENG